MKNCCDENMENKKNTEWVFLKINEILKTSYFCPNQYILKIQLNLL